jgi:cyclopropane fatty-acyl-phospholipid synthase-like methyltransferase
MQHKTPWYKSWFNTSFYHKLYFKRNEAEAQEFIANLFNKLHIEPNSLVLDIACGKGRHARMMAQLGHTVTGIDLSKESIKYANEHVIPNVEFFVHDMLYPMRINYYHVVTNFFTSMGYFAKPQHDFKAFKAMYDNLKEGGLMVIDFFNEQQVFENLVANETKEIENTLYEIKRWADENYFYKQITVTDESLPESQTYTERVSRLSKAKLNNFAAQLNLSVINEFGDYQLNNFNAKESKRFIMVCKK